MNRKLLYILSLTGFFVMWGVFGFAAGAPRSEPSQAAVLPRENTALVTDAAADEAGPITRERQSDPGRVIVYGLIGLGALAMILALRNKANKATAPYVRRKGPPDES